MGPFLHIQLFLGTLNISYAYIINNGDYIYNYKDYRKESNINFEGLCWNMKGM